MSKSDGYIRDAKVESIPLSDEKIKDGIIASDAFYYRFIKRLFDIFVSLFGLIIFSPVMLLIAVLIKAEDGGPVFYVSPRIGTGLKPISLYKFRSMEINAADRVKELLPKNDLGENAYFKLKHDPRITKVGKIIRKLSLDELPQLFNVLRGDISLIGPRPHSEYEVEKYDDYAMQRFLVKSGVMCFSECKGRSDLMLDESVELDIRYVRERGILTDIKIIFMAVGAILRHNGAV